MTNPIDPATDPRFNYGLFDDVAQVLRQHGYHPPEESAERYSAYGTSMLLLLRLCTAYEGAEPPPGEVDAADLERLLGGLS